MRNTHAVIIGLALMINSHVFANPQGGSLGCNEGRHLSTAPEQLEALEASTDLANAHLTAAAPPAPPAAPEESKRFQLFRMDKDYNPKNVLHYGVNVNVPSCTVTQTANGAPSFNNYWHMGEEDGRRKLMTKKDLERLGPIVVSHNPNQVVFKMNAFKEVKLNKKEITITTAIVNGECKVNAHVTLNDGRNMNIRRIFAKISYFLGIPTGVSSLDIEGQDRSSGAAIKMNMQ